MLSKSIPRIESAENEDAMEVQGSLARLRFRQFWAHILCQGPPDLDIRDISFKLRYIARVFQELMTDLDILKLNSDFACVRKEI